MMPTASRSDTTSSSDAAPLGQPAHGIAKMSAATIAPKPSSRPFAGLSWTTRQSSPHFNSFQQPLGMIDRAAIGQVERVRRIRPGMHLAPRRRDHRLPAEHMRRPVPRHGRAGEQQQVIAIELQVAQPQASHGQDMLVVAALPVDPQGPSGRSMRVPSEHCRGLPQWPSASVSLSSPAVSSQQRNRLSPARAAADRSWWIGSSTCAITALARNRSSRRSFGIRLLLAPMQDRPAMAGLLLVAPNPLDPRQGTR